MFLFPLLSTQQSVENMSHFIYFHSSRPYVSLIQVNQITRVKQDPVNWLVSQLAKSLQLSLSVTPDKKADSQLSTGLLFKFCTIDPVGLKQSQSFIDHSVFKARHQERFQ